MVSYKTTDFSRQFSFEKLQEEKKKQQKKWMYIVLMGAFLFQMFPFCIAMNLNNVFAGSDWYKWTNGNTIFVGLTFTVGSLSALLGPFIAKLFSKKNIKLVYILGVTIAMIGFSIIGFNALVPSTNRSLPIVLVLLWGGFFIAQIGVLIFSGIGINNLITRWWPPEKKGIALGITFTGGSLGNIWLQQLVGVLSKKFGNIVGLNYDVDGTQYVTYFILAAIGLVSGIIIALFACKRPLPTIDIFSNNSNIKSDIKSKNDSTENGVSFLHTRKYPIYWMLAIGFFILQMGGVFTTTNGTFIRNATIFNNPNIDYNTLLANGGTIFGVSCLIGNSCGGLLNDKIGPNKSVALGALLQTSAIIFLIMSPGNVDFVYIYFLLSGFSIYIFTSTIAYMSSRLFGSKQSNSQTAILGIFVALGFAITNSISGPLMQDTQSLYDLFGYKTKGNMIPLFIFAIMSCLIGGLLIFISSTIMMNKGVKGMIEYNDTKYSRIIFLKHSFYIKLNTLKITILKKDKRINDKQNNKNEDILAISEVINKYIKKFNLNKKQLCVINLIAFNQKIIMSWLINKFGNSANKIIDELLSKKLINKYQLFNGDVLIKINPNLESQINEINVSNEIKKANLDLNNSLESINNKLIHKITKLNSKIEIENSKLIDEKKQNKLVIISEKKLKNLNNKNNKLFNNDWKQYVYEYSYLEKKDFCFNIRNKLTTKKQNKINSLQRKINISKYTSDFNISQEIIGHSLLLDYYTNKNNHINQIINSHVERYYQNKIDKLETKKRINNLKITKLKNKISSIDLIKTN